MPRTGPSAPLTRAAGFGIDVRDVDENNRVSVGGLADGLAWVVAGEFLLGVLVTTGCLRLVANDEVLAVNAQKEDLHARLPDRAAENELMILESRYLQLRVEPGRRVVLSALVRAHLGVAAGATLYVVRAPSKIELWSAAYRDKHMPREIAGLP